MTSLHRKIALVDPQTLVGKELLRLLDRSGSSLETVLFHTGSEDEHQVTDLAEGAGLVTPLGAPDDLAGCDAVVAASEVLSDRAEHVAEFVEGHPEVPFVAVGCPSRLAELGLPAACAPVSRPSPPRLRTAHPSLVAAHAALRPLTDLEPASLAVTALEPVSVYGAGAIDGLARQAASRLRGEPAKPDERNRVTAFNIVVAPSEELTKEAAQIFPNLSVSTGLAAGGWFHGHAASLAVTFPAAVGEAEIRERWESVERLVVVEDGLRLDSVVDCEQVLLAPPQLSGDGRTLCVMAMVDSLLVGGAATALELLLSLL